MPEKPTYEELVQEIERLNKTVSQDETGHVIGTVQDITERKQAEEALRKSEERFSKAFRFSPNPLLISTFKEGRCVDVNASFLSLFGYNRKEIIGRTTQELKLWAEPNDRSKMIQSLEKSSQATLPDVMVRTKSGKILIMTFSAAKIEIKGEECLITTALDTTEQKLLEKALLENEYYLEQAQSIAKLGHWKLNPETMEVSGSNELSRLFGLSQKETTFEAFATVVHPDDREYDLYHINRGIEEGTSWDIEHRLVLKDGTEKIVHAIGLPSIDKSGKVSEIVGTVQDITERKQVEEALRESEEKYRSMLEAMKDAAYICSSEFCISYMNPRMISKVGRNAVGELCHKAIYNSDEKCSWCIFDQIQQGKHVEYELADPSDNRYYSVTNSPILHSGGLISKLSIFRDITENKTIESQLRQAHKMESIGTMAGGIAHDFNNLLYMITGNTELALEDIPEWNQAYANLEVIKTAALRAAGIVKQLLSFSRKTDQKLIPLGAIAIIKDALKFLRATIPATVEIRKHLPDTEITVMADPVQINQLLMNLCTNASQAMEETGGILEITARYESLTENSAQNYLAGTEENYLKLTVSDTGSGIDSEIISRIFDPYFSTKEMGKGSGMGLAVVHGIVNNHNGSITVDSARGKGAIFTILLPVVDEKPEKKTKSSDKVPLGNESILFVDDEKAITYMTGQILKRLGYTVETKVSPAAALELFQSKPGDFDLVITDMTMPQMTGVTLSEKLKAVRPDIPVIICTGNSSLIDEEKAKQMGIDAYIMKPIVKSDIAIAIRKALDKRQDK